MRSSWNRSPAGPWLHSAPGKVWCSSDTEPVAVVKEPCQPWEEVVSYREGTTGNAPSIGDAGQHLSAGPRSWGCRGFSVACPHGSRWPWSAWQCV